MRTLTLTMWFYRNYPDEAKRIVEDFLNNLSSTGILTLCHGDSEDYTKLTETFRMCLSYPQCDGDLEGIPHEPACPLYVPPKDTTEV